MLKTMLADEKAERTRLQDLLLNRIDRAYERKEELESLVFERIGLVHREDKKTEPPVQVGRTHSSARATLARLESDRKKQYWEQVASKVGPPGVDVSAGEKGNDNEIRPSSGD
jgi:hypothetical protein